MIRPGNYSSARAEALAPWEPSTPTPCRCWHVTVVLVLAVALLGAVIMDVQELRHELAAFHAHTTHAELVP